MTSFSKLSFTERSTTWFSDIRSEFSFLVHQQSPAEDILWNSHFQQKEAEWINNLLNSAIAIELKEKPTNVLINVHLMQNNSILEINEEDGDDEP